MSDAIIKRVKYPFGYVVFNRPHIKNALNLEMWKGIPKVLKETDEDHKIRVIF